MAGPVRGLDVGVSDCDGTGVPGRERVLGWRHVYSMVLDL